MEKLGRTATALCGVPVACFPHNLASHSNVAVWLLPFADAQGDDGVLDARRQVTRFLTHFAKLGAQIWLHLESKAKSQEQSRSSSHFERTTESVPQSGHLWSKRLYDCFDFLNSSIEVI